MSILEKRVPKYNILISNNILNEHLKTNVSANTNKNVYVIANVCANVCKNVFVNVPGPGIILAQAAIARVFAFQATCCAALAIALFAGFLLITPRHDGNNYPY